MSTLQERLRALRRMYWGGDTAALDEAIARIDADAERIKALEAARAKDTERLATLAAKNLALEADAERYRWLREHRHYAVLETLGYSYAQIEHWSNEQNEAKMDAAIDAARSKT